MTSAPDTEIEPVLAGRSAECASGAGVLFDAELVVAGAPAVLTTADVADRTAVVGVLLRIGAAGW